jgi:hypothetical protein
MSFPHLLFHIHFAVIILFIVMYSDKEFSERYYQAPPQRAEAVVSKQTIPADFL